MLINETTLSSNKGGNGWFKSLWYDSAIDLKLSARWTLPQGRLRINVFNFLVIF